MLFNSYEYLLAFLPISAILYFTLIRQGWMTSAKVWLVIASLAFYSWWGLAYLPLITFSIFVNYATGTALSIARISQQGRKGLLAAGIVFNLGLLGYFKYANFFVDNLNNLTGSDIHLARIALPLAISFFTFQKIAYLIDSYRAETVGYNFLDYALFVTFFPQLIAGPIVHHKEMVRQFAGKLSPRDYGSIATGLSVLSIGLFKKVMIADTFAVFADSGFDDTTSITCLGAWVASLSYTFQLYFDFSGYADMAIGSALIFNIKLPINFNSPYQAIEIQDFWRRWHITLSRFLRDYLYIPLGGNRHGKLATYTNLFLTFLIGGLWHGASWMFVIWGAMHGAAVVVHRVWSQAGRTMPTILAWLLTFNFVNIAWVFFRAKDMTSARRILSGMADLGDGSLFKMFDIDQRYATILIGVALGIVLLGKPTVVFCTQSDHEERSSVISGAALAISLVAMSFVTAGASQFLYFNF
ncbi:MBOAT family O-acyltransferase [Bradyrhizobium tropiciagri]|uniref:MBOAT family O-acyltransferase n=1 Tax=Bradyrhizobium tropiciagri TaxID=312253 RepID=UPI00067AF60D|nr:MBOAT family protein [Bradyrhizobium tropiciagri]